MNVYVENLLVIGGFFLVVVSVIGWCFYKDKNNIKNVELSVIFEMVLSFCCCCLSVLYSIYLFFFVIEEKKK